MKERVLLRFDTFIAVCALLASAVAAGAMVYQTRVIEEQFSATVWPYLSVEVDNYPTSVTLKLANDGAGPALVRSAQLVVDGKPAAGWNDILAPLIADRALSGHGRLTARSESVDASMTIRSGDMKTLLSLSSPNEQIIAAARRHTITLKMCYCSINNRCWQLSDTPGSKTAQLPRAVAECAIGSSIEAEPLKSPTARKA